MGKLHIYEWKKDGSGTQIADGDGTIDKSKDFSVTVTSPASGFKIIKNHHYEIREGAQLSGVKCQCMAGCETKGSVAKFAIWTDVTCSDFHNAVALRAITAAATKTVTINIDAKDLETLKSSKYRLCFAKKIEAADYNIVWQSYFAYLTTNTFSWMPMYQLFGSNTFKANIAVNVSTNLVEIGLGEISTLDKAGVLGHAVTGEDKTSITMQNDYGDIHPGVSQVSTGIDGQQTNSPIYVAPQSMVSGKVGLIPIEKVLVWFEQNTETGTMFSDARSMEIELDLTGTNSANATYESGNWKVS